MLLQGVSMLLPVSQHVTVGPLLVIVTSLDMILQSLYMLLPVSLHVIARHLVVID